MDADRDLACSAVSCAIIVSTTSVGASACGRVEWTWLAWTDVIRVRKCIGGEDSRSRCRPNSPPGLGRDSGPGERWRTGSDEGPVVVRRWSGGRSWLVVERWGR